MRLLAMELNRTDTRRTSAPENKGRTRPAGTRKQLLSLAEYDKMSAGEFQSAKYFTTESPAPLTTYRHPQDRPQTTPLNLNQ